MTKINLSYQVPIQVIETPIEGSEELEFLIQGIAINSTVTDNKHKFVSEELESAAHTLSNVPLLKDHNNSVDSIVGRVIKSEFNHLDENIMFKARINNTEQGKHIKNLIKSGDLNTVSIGANVESLEESDEGLFIPRGIIFKELSVVAVPADSDAKFTFTGNSFDLALKEAYKEISKSQIDMVDDSKLNERGLEMEEDRKNTQPLENSEIKQEVESLKKEFNELTSELKSLSEQLKAQTDLLASSLVEESDADEEPAPAEEAPAEEPEPAPEPEPAAEEAEPEAEEPAEEEAEAEELEEEEEDEEEVDEKSGYKIVQNHKSFTIEHNNY